MSKRPGKSQRLEEAARAEQRRQEQRAHANKWVPLSEVAQRLGVCARTIRNWEKRGLIELRRLGHGGRLVGLTEGEFEAWLQANVITKGEVG